MKLLKHVAKLTRHRSRKRRPLQLGFDRFEERVLLAVFSVISNADPGTGVGPNGSLRYVINQLNNSPDATNAILFDIGTGLQTITLASDLPAITKEVTINGYSEDGASPNTASIGTNAVIMVQIQIPNGGVSNAALVFAPGSEGSVVRGLSIFGADNGTFGGDAGIDLDANDVTVAGDFIGVQADGMTAGPNREGIIVEDSTGDVIGTPAPADRNVISGNTDSGILEVTDVSAAAGLLVQGNLIGTDRTGLAAIPNDYGIEMIGGSTLDNTIGGTTAGAGNVISGNFFDDIVSFGGATPSLPGPSSNTIQGNLIGLTADGSSTLGPNPASLSDYGIELLFGSANNTIGGTLPGAGNVIGGNGLAGIHIDGSATGNLVLGNLIGTNASGANLGNVNGVAISTSTGTSNTIGGTALGAGNVISANSDVGVSLNGASGVVIQGNLIGLAADGTTILGQGGDGIELNGGSTGNTIGGTLDGTGNIVSGNGEYGVDLPNGSGDNDNLIAGNIVGLDGSNNDAPNVSGGMIIDGTDNTVGGTVSAARNVISGNDDLGLEIDGDTLVIGNYIGTDSNGNPVVGVLQIIGIVEEDSSGDTIGGTTAAARNVISGNGSQGIYINGSMSLIEGNYIGTNPAGTAAVPNGIGVEVAGSNNTIGGTAAGTGNVISGNTTGVLLSFGESGVAIQGNIIGLAANGSSILGQSINGISLFDASHDDTIGGTIAGAGNTISGNGGYGIDFADGSSYDILIAGNIVGLDGSNNVASNLAGGIFIAGTGNTVGGTVTAARNVISGNQNAGLEVDGDTLVVGNYIGTDSNGNALAASPQLTGIADDGASNTVGGTTAAARNVISGNANEGISLGGSLNLIEGNYVGTNAAGTAAVPNGNGVTVDGSNHTIGGTALGAGNVISGNNTDGVSLSGASGVVIEGNIIGLAANGSSILGNGFDGIDLSGGSSGNTIGGTVAGAGNVIGGNEDLRHQRIRQLRPGTSSRATSSGRMPAEPS